MPLRRGARACSRVGTGLGVCVSLARRLCRSLRPQAGILVLSKVPVSLRESPLDLLLRANGLLFGFALLQGTFSVFDSCLVLPLSPSKGGSTWVPHVAALGDGPATCGAPGGRMCVMQGQKSQEGLCLTV